MFVRAKHLFLEAIGDGWPGGDVAQRVHRGERLHGGDAALSIAEDTCGHDSDQRAELLKPRPILAATMFTVALTRCMSPRRATPRLHANSSPWLAGERIRSVDTGAWIGATPAAMAVLGGCQVPLKPKRKHRKVER